jgi:ABC-type transporter Mla subunit MlaD
MKFTAAAKVGLTAIILALVFIGIFRGMGWSMSWLSGKKAGDYFLYMQFASVKGLKPGADVQLNGNAIGEVVSLDNPDFGGVIVKVVIHGDKPIHITHHRDSQTIFTISRESIFGSYMITIDEPGSGQLVPPVANNRAVVKMPAGKVSTGASVWKDDIDIGLLESVERINDYMDSVTILLTRDVELNESMAFMPYQPLGSDITGLDVYVRLIPNSPSDPVSGDREPGPEDLVVDVDKQLAKMSLSAQQVLTQVAGLLGNVSELIDKEQVQGLIDTLSTEIVTIADNVVRLTGRLDAILAENQPYLNQTMSNVEGITGETRDLISGLQEYNTPERKAQIEAIIANLTTATETLSKVLDDVESLTGDEQVQGDLKATISQARATLEQAQSTLASAGQTIDQANSNIAAVGGIEANGEFTLRYAPSPDRWTADLEVYLRIKRSNTYFIAGLNDIGEDQSTNAQVGWWITDDLGGRVGIHRGKIGMGADWRSDPYDFATELYDPNDLTWDLYGGYAILPELGLVVGVEDLLGRDEVNLGLAFRF